MMTNYQTNMNIPPSILSSQSNTVLPDVLVHRISEFLGERDNACLGATNTVNKEFLGEMTKAVYTRRALEKNVIETLLKSRVHAFIDTGYMDTIFRYDKLDSYIDHFGLYDDSIVADNGNFRNNVEFTITGSIEVYTCLIEMVIELVPSQSLAFVMKIFGLDTTKPVTGGYTMGDLKVGILNSNDIYDITEYTRMDIIMFGDNINSIGNSAFTGSQNLKAVVISDSVTEIGENAFSACYRLQSIVLPKSLTEIGNSAFRRCLRLKSIIVPDSVTYLGDNVFDGCRNTSYIEIPDSVAKIGIRGFSGCSKLTSINIPNSLKVIEPGLFCSCSSLESIEIPESVDAIGENAFRGCNMLSSVAIPDSVTSIGDYAFTGCVLLETIPVRSR